MLVHLMDLFLAVIDIEVRHISAITKLLQLHHNRSVIVINIVVLNDAVRPFTIEFMGLVFVVDVNADYLLTVIEV